MGPFSPRQSEPLAALPASLAAGGVKLTRALSGWLSGLRPLSGLLSKRALRTRQSVLLSPTL